jgi:beta-ketodecanoyl-[acyl-carrier-protein] synthase
MGLAAAKSALDQANKSAKDVGMLISACSNFERPYPSLAIEVQKALGIVGFAFDMNVACSSVPFAIRLAYNSLITQPELPGVLIVTPEFYTGHLNFRDRDSHFIFGDAAGALYLERSKTSKSNNIFSVKNIQLLTHFSNNIRNDGGFLRQAVNRNDPWHPRNLFSQQGRAVFKEIIPLVSEMILDQLEEENIERSSVKRVWLHQANSKMNLLLAKKILAREPSPSELPLVLNKYGNTGAAGVVLAFSESQNLDQGSWGVFCAFGAGYSAGSVLLQKC